MDNRGNSVTHSIDLRQALVALGLTMTLVLTQAAGAAQAAEDRVHLAMQAVDRNDCPAALNLLQQAVRDDDKAAALALSFLRESKLCVPSRSGKIRRLFDGLPEMTEGDASGKLGCLYEDGNGRPKDQKQARYWFKRTALAFDPKYAPVLARVAMMATLGDCGLSGILNKEFNWAEELSVSDAHRKFRIAMDFKEGKRLPRDDRKGMSLLEDASDSIPAAFYEIGRWYLEGFMGVSDMKKAQSAMSRGAYAGNVPAMKEYGVLLAGGDDRGAILWLRYAKAAGAEVDYILAKLGGTPSEEERKFFRRTCRERWGEEKCPEIPRKP